MAPPSALSLSWSSSTMLSLSPLMAPASAAVKFGRKGFDPVTRPLPDNHNSRIQVMCGNALAVAVSTSKSTSVSGSSGISLLNDLRGNSNSLDITRLECFDIISPKRQEIVEEDDTKHLKIALPLKSGQDLYEFDTYHRDQHSHFGSCLAPFLEQLQVRPSLSTVPQQLVQSVCTNPKTSRETTSENQETSFTIAGRDVVALAKAAVEAANHVAALVESQPFAEAYGQKSFVFAREPLHPLIADKDTSDKKDMLANSQTFEVDLAGGKISKLDEQQSQSDVSVKVLPNKENVTVRSNLQIAKKAKRDWMSRKINKSASGFRSLRVHQSGKLLSAKEEVELSQRVQILLKLEKLKASLQERLGCEPTSVEWAEAAGIDENCLNSRLKEGWTSKDRMMKSNTRLVVSVAKHYKGLGISLPDLIQAGNRGLMCGIEKFDYKKGYKFSTYAHWWIRNSLTRFISNHSRTVRMPVNLREILYRIKEAKKLLAGEDGRLASNEEVAELVGVTVPRMREALKFTRRPISLDWPSREGFDTTLGETVADVDDGSPEPNMWRKIMKQDIDKLLRTLTPKQREILSLRHGLIDGRSRTLEEVGDVFDISRERIRQLESDAWRKLKQQKIKPPRYYFGTV